MGYKGNLHLILYATKEHQIFKWKNQRRASNISLHFQWVTMAALRKMVLMGVAMEGDQLIRRVLNGPADD